MAAHHLTGSIAAEHQQCIGRFTGRKLGLRLRVGETECQLGPWLVDEDSGVGIQTGKDQRHMNVLPCRSWRGWFESPGAWKQAAFRIASQNDDILVLDTDGCGYSLKSLQGVLHVFSISLAVVVPRSSVLLQPLLVWPPMILVGCPKRRRNQVAPSLFPGDFRLWARRPLLSLQRAPTLSCDTLSGCATRWCPSHTCKVGDPVSAEVVSWIVSNRTGLDAVLMTRHWIVSGSLFDSLSSVEWPCSGSKMVSLRRMSLFSCTLSTMASGSSDLSSLVVQVEPVLVSDGPSLDHRMPLEAPWQNCTCRGNK